MSRNELTDPVGRASALASSVTACADEIERTRRLPAALLAEIHAARLARLLLPRVYGGDEVHPRDYALALEAIARHDASVGWNLFVANSACLLTPFMPPDTARTVYAEPDAWVAWGPPDDQRARAVDGGYVVDGTWGFASGCHQANWMGAHCQVEEADGSLRLNAAGRPAVISFLFPANEAKLLDTWNTLGLRGTGSDSYRVNSLFVSEAFTGTREAPESRVVPGPLYWFTQQGLYAVGVAAVALGVAHGMLAEFMQLSTRKTPRGRPRLKDQPSIRALVARAEAQLGSARSYLTTVLDRLYGEAEEWGAMAVPDRAAARLACTHAIVTAVAVADRIHKAAGVSAIFTSQVGFERRFRDIHTLSQQIQARDAHFEAVGGILLGDDAGPFY